MGKSLPPYRAPGQWPGAPAPPKAALEPGIWIRGGCNDLGDLENALTGYGLGVRFCEGTPQRNPHSHAQSHAEGDGYLGSWCVVRLPPDALPIDEDGFAGVDAIATGFSRRGAYDLLDAIAARLRVIEASDYAPHHYEDF